MREGILLHDLELASGGILVLLFYLPFRYFGMLDTLPLLRG